MAAIPKGTLVVDGKSGKVGVVQEVVCGTAWLRPQGGGREWTAAPEVLEPVREGGSA
jgi:hypothetical protein